MKLEKFYDTAYDWVLIHGPNILFGIIVLIVGLWFISFLKARIRRKMSTREVNSSLQPFLLSLSITALNICLVLLVMQILGIEATIFTTLVGAFGVAAGLALSGTLQNFAGGVLILLLKPFELNDNIIAQGQDGKVTSIQIFYTVLLTADNKTIIIPNGKLFNEVIVNVTREGNRRLDFELELGYAANPEMVKAIILEAINNTPHIIPKLPMRVGIARLAFDRMTFLVNVWVKPSEFLTVKIELQEKIMKRLTEEGIKFPGT
ncbi:mechanosensitive ion channel family protein [Mucilaginibacter hurinus]|uniref:Mechanosensitive ion channel family protein n=1 Tax=Mucilaginibacter hurinus TaxID=2201324 RepID=A0A367GK86_9SPHI|nr:mechanosensitive ion channel family protein [Mucilaginibacter hurinus]RCH53730.1 mechanosensitive ion channel family protein [Mucilaginibacter hurinus]